MNGLQISTIILAVSIALFSFFLWVSIMGTATQGRRTVEKRVNKIASKKSGLTLQIQEKKKERKSSILKRAINSNGKHSVQRKKLMDTIFNELILADIMMKPEEFTLIWIVLTFVPAGLAALFRLGLMPSATLAAIGAFIPIIFIKIKKDKRRKAFEAQLGDTLIMMCNGLRSGFSFNQVMENVANDMPPIGIEFGRVCNEIRYGATMEEALNNMCDRVKSADLMLVVSAVLIQRTTGGNLSEMLSTISHTIRERIKIKGEINSITAQGRMSGLIIGALPIGIAAVLMVVNPDYMSTFFTTKIGNIMLVVSVVMEVIGFFAIRKVVTIDY